MEGAKFNFIPSIDAGPEEIRKRKAEINNEGMEGNAAVLIGDEQELDVLQEKIESEGNAKDLPTYIQIHKEIDVPREELAESYTNLPRGTATVMEENGEVYVAFIDKEKNIAKLKYNPEKIEGMESKDPHNAESEFAKLGFDFTNKGAGMDIKRRIASKKINDELALKKEEKENFDF